MIPFPTPTSFISGIGYFFTFVATLRAGSRAKYLFQNDGVLGQIDGPLLLPGSNLWEAAFGFECAVSFALTECCSVECMNEDIKSQIEPSDIDSILMSEIATPAKATSSSTLAYRLRRFSTNTKAMITDFLYEDESNDEANFYSLSPYASYDETGLRSKISITDSNNTTSISTEEKEIKLTSPFQYLKRKCSPSILQVEWQRRRLSLLSSLHSNNLSIRNWGLSSNKKRQHGGIIRQKSEKKYDTLIESSKQTDLSSFHSKIMFMPTKFSSNNMGAIDGKVDAANSDFDISQENHSSRQKQRKRAAKVIAYAPKIFSELRSQFGISEKSFLNSLQGPYVSFQSNSKGAARSGGFFFFSRDGAYLVKTVKKAEAETLLKMLPKYYKYMCRNSRRSLLTRFCGMYQVRLGDASPMSDDSSSKLHFMPSKGEDYVFIVMNSVFPTEGSKFISERFDLKGSTVGRECSLIEREEKGANAVLKDLDLAKELQSLDLKSRRASNYGMSIGASSKATLLSQLRRDVGLLVECEVMDYSLLVGIVDMEGSFKTSSHLNASIRNKKEGLRPFVGLLNILSVPFRIVTAPPRYLKNQIVSLGAKTVSTVLTLPLPYYGAGFNVVDGGELSVLHGVRSGHRAIYYVGLIDFLQPWTVKKLFEREVKGLLGYDKKALSCVDPKYYASRFLNFIDVHLS